MRSLPPESDSDGQQDEPPETTDFQSLDSTAVSARQRERAPVATDFAALRASMAGQRKGFGRRTATDYLLDALIPFMIFLMVWSIIFFLLDVRYIYTEVHNNNLRFVTFCFVMGIVALNRVVARDGSAESILYIVGLAGAMGMYTLATTEMYGVGSFSRNFMNTSPWLASGFNMAIVGLIWWVTNRLMHECCVDDQPTAGDIGILTGTAQRIQRAIGRKPESARRKRLDKARLDMHVIEAHDPTEWKKPEAKKKVPVDAATKRLSKRHPGVSVFYFSVPAMIIFSLGLRVVQQGGESMVRAGRVYLGCYTVAALMLLLLTSLGGVREYFRARRTAIPAALGWFWIGLGVVMMAMVLVGATQMPAPKMPPMAAVGEHQTDFWTRTSTFKLANPALTAAELIETSRFMDRIGQGVLICLGLFMAYSLLRLLGSAAASIARRRDLYPQFVRRFFNALDRFLQAITQIPALPKVRPAIRVRRDVATCARFTNPLGDLARAGSMTIEDKVEHAYQALCALAHDLGVPRKDGETPYEFIESFPKPLKTLREEAVELTNLYVLSAYSGRPLGPRTEDRLRKFWLEYERARRRVLR